MQSQNRCPCWLQHRNIQTLERGALSGLPAACGLESHTRKDLVCVCWLLAAYPVTECVTSTANAPACHACKVADLHLCQLSWGTEAMHVRQPMHPACLPPVTTATVASFHHFVSGIAEALRPLQQKHHCSDLDPGHNVRTTIQDTMCQNGLLLPLSPAKQAT